MLCIWPGRGAAGTHPPASLILLLERRHCSMRAIRYWRYTPCAQQHIEELSAAPRSYWPPAHWRRYEAEVACSLTSGRIRRRSRAKIALGLHARPAHAWLAGTGSMRPNPRISGRWPRDVLLAVASVLLGHEAEAEGATADQFIGDDASSRGSALMSNSDCRTRRKVNSVMAWYRASRAPHQTPGARESNLPLREQPLERRSHTISGSGTWRRLVGPPYRPGGIRDIDWRVTTLQTQPYSKLFRRRRAGGDLWS